MRSSPDYPSGDCSLAEQAYRLLEDQIITLVLQPGQLLTERELAAITGIGRTPVREAVQQLAAGGLLNVLPRKGLMVTLVQPSDLSKVLETRKVLGRLLVVKASERATADQRQALGNVAQHIETADEQLAGFLRLKRHLAELLAMACHNPYLADALAATRGQCHRWWHMYQDDIDLPRLKHLHGALARMVAGGNGAGAIRAQDEVTAMLHDLATGKGQVA